MKLNDLKTPFGDLTVHLWVYTYTGPHMKHLHLSLPKPSVAFSGDVIVNRVEYNVRFEAKFNESWKIDNGAWMMNRKDKKDGPFPFNAREKLGNNVLELLPLIVTPAIWQQAEEEDRQKRIQDLVNESDSLRRRLAEVSKELDMLQPLAVGDCFTIGNGDKVFKKVSEDEYRCVETGGTYTFHSLMGSGKAYQLHRVSRQNA